MRRRTCSLRTPLHSLRCLSLLASHLLDNLLFTIIGTSLAGAGVIAVLSMGLASWQPIVAGAVLGALLGLPAAWIVAQKIRHLQ